MGRLQRIWYWYYLNTNQLCKIVFLLIWIPLVIWVIVTGVNQGTYLVAVTFGAVSSVGIAIIMSWLHNQYLIEYDNGMRWIRGLPPKKFS